MYDVITIDREYGSGAVTIAKELAGRLGWRLWDELLSNEIATDLNCDSQTVEKRAETRDPLYYRLFKGFMQGSFEGALNTPKLDAADADCIRDAAERVVLRAAKSGKCIIVGRGSAYYLRDWPNVFHVFVYAPFNEKLRRLCAEGKSESEAIRLADTVDRDRAAFIRQYFGKTWPDRYLFQLMVNSTIGEEAAVQTILNAAAAISGPSAVPTGAGASAHAAEAASAVSQSI